MAFLMDQLFYELKPKITKADDRVIATKALIAADAIYSPAIPENF